MIHRRSPLIALAALALAACATTPVASPAPKLDAFAVASAAPLPGEGGQATP